MCARDWDRRNASAVAAVHAGAGAILNPTTKDRPRTPVPFYPDIAPAPNTTSFPTAIPRFPSVPLAHAGSLSSPVTYLTTPTLQLDELESLLSSRFLSLPSGPDLTPALAKNLQQYFVSASAAGRHKPSSLPTYKPSLRPLQSPPNLSSQPVYQSPECCLLVRSSSSSSEFPFPLALRTICWESAWSSDARPYQPPDCGKNRSVAEDKTFLPSAPSTPHPPTEHQHRTSLQCAYPLFRIAISGPPPPSRPLP